jgi:hypothetical protein
MPPKGSKKRAAPDDDDDAEDLEPLCSEQAKKATTLPLKLGLSKWWFHLTRSHSTLDCCLRDSKEATLKISLLQFTRRGCYMILVCIAYARQFGTDLLLTLNDWTVSREEIGAPWIQASWG